MGLPGPELGPGSLGGRARLKIQPDLHQISDLQAVSKAISWRFWGGGQPGGPPGVQVPGFNYLLVAGRARPKRAPLCKAVGRGRGIV